MAFAGKWIKLKIMMLSKVTDHKDKNQHIFSHFQTIIFNFICMYEVVNISQKLERRIRNIKVRDDV